MIARITKAYVRTYTDTGQRTAYVEWVDRCGKAGRTEGACHPKFHMLPMGAHMMALFSRAVREGVTVTRECW